MKENISLSDNGPPVSLTGGKNNKEGNVMIYGRPVWYANIYKTVLDRGSIRSSPRDGLSSPYRLNSAGLFHNVLVYMGDLQLVLPVLNLSILDAGILIMVQQISLMMFSLNMVDYRMSFLLLFT